MTPTAAMAVTAVDITALCTAIGALACLMWIIPANGASQGRRLWALLAVCLAFLTLDSVLLFLYRSHVLSELPFGRLAPVLPKVLGQTHYGQVWLVRIAVIAGGWIIWWSGRKAPGRRGTAAAMAAALTVIAFTRSATGHSADQGDFTLLEIMDWVHLVGASLWAGTVTAAVLIVFHSTRGIDAAAFNALARRLSQLATVALLLVLATGVYNTWEKLLSIKSLWQTDYGHILLLKIGLVGIMIALGAINRFVHLNRLSAGGSPDNTTVQRRFMRLLRVEAVTALAVFIAAAILINTLPPHAGMDAMSGMKM
jgi:putative copper resistance protein D